MKSKITYGSGGVKEFNNKALSGAISQRREILEKFVGNKYYSVLGIMTHSTCNLSCEHCTVMPWMVKHKKKPYEMTKENIANFIYWSKKSDYFFNLIVLSGGEPLIWKDLLESLKLLHPEKGKLYNTFRIQTNLL